MVEAIAVKDHQFSPTPTCRTLVDREWGAPRAESIGPTGSGDSGWGQPLHHNRAYLFMVR